MNPENNFEVMKFNELLKKKIRALQLASLGLFSLLILYLLIAINDFRSINAENTLKLNNLIEIENLVLQSNIVLEKYKSPRRVAEQIKTVWQQIWQKIESRPDSTESGTSELLIKGLAELEVLQWRLIETSSLSGNWQATHIFEHFIDPQAQQSFKLTTELIEKLKNSNSTAALGKAADMRGYFTLAHVQVSSALHANKSLLWNEYRHAIAKFEEELQSLKQDNVLSTVVSSQTILKTLSQNVERYKHNTQFLRQILYNNPVDSNQSKLVHLVEHLQILNSEIMAQVDVVKAKQSQLESTLVFQVLFFLIVAFIIGSIVFVLMHNWRRTLVEYVTNPIELIVENAVHIANGKRQVEISTNSNIDEIHKLVNSIQKIKQIIDDNSNRLDEKMREQSLRDSISELNLAFKEPVRFCEVLLPVVCNKFNVMSGALFLLPELEERTPLLVAKYNVSDDRYVINSKLKGDFLEQCFSAGKLQRVHVSHSHLDVARVSATTTVLPNQILLIPISDSSKTIGVLELCFAQVNSLEDKFWLDLSERLSTILTAKLRQEQTKELLATTQSQKERLNQAMEELKIQHENLQRSEAELEMQAEELKSTNIQLKKHSTEQERQAKRLEKLNNELEQKSVELKRADELKSRFLSNVSHELRTPLNSIVILLKTLIREPENLNESQLRSLQVIEDSSQDLLELINDLLDMAKIEAGELSVEFAECSLSTLTAKLQDQFNPIANQSGLDFDLELDKDLPKSIFTDESRLLQILRNFLANAFKFTESGAIKLKVENAGELVRFAVHDTGIGISEDNQALIFESFKQVKQASISSREGTGLGLSIASQLAVALNGKIHITSEEGKGSVFSIDIPLKSSPNNITASNKHLPDDASHGNDSSVKNDAPTDIDSAANNPLNSQEANACYYIGPKDSLFSELQETLDNKIDLIWINQRDFNRHVLDQTCGVIIRADSDNGKEIQAFIEPILQEINEGINVIALVTNQVNTTFKWLEIVADYTFKWNEAGKKQLYKTIFQSKSNDKQDDDMNQSAPIVSFSKSFKVLVVDDDIRTLFSVGQLLKQASLQAELSDNLQLATEKISTEKYDAVVTDLSLPEGDGIDLIMLIRNELKLKSLPIIVTSARNLESAKKEALEAGCDLYFDKPVNPNELIVALKELVD